MKKKIFDILFQAFIIIFVAFIFLEIGLTYGKTKRVQAEIVTKSEVVKKVEPEQIEEPVTEIEEEIIEEEPIEEEPEPEPELKSIGIFTITNYCESCNGINGEYGTSTSTGAKATPGRTVAVDPSIIPYGTHLIINGEEYIAEDCGVSGHVIDVFVSDHSQETKYTTEVFVKTSN